MEQNGESRTTAPLVTVIVLNYNGARWLERCLASLRAQTIFDSLEIIVADNASPDKSDLLAAQIMHSWPNGKVVQHGDNLGFCEGNNRAARFASGEYLLFLNNDTWLEPSCLEELLVAIANTGAEVGQPLIVDYDDDTLLSPVTLGFDIFGLLSLGKAPGGIREIFVPVGCSYMIRRDLFFCVGGFDSTFFMYADEYDLSWRVWAAGGRAIVAPRSRLHHRGAANVNPQGGVRMVESRTSDTKRYYTNRNCLLLLLKNAQHVLLLLVPLQLLLLGIEAFCALLLVRRWAFIKRAYFDAIAACWALRRHVLVERGRIREYRRRSDWQMLRFLRLRPNRWDELLSLRRHGLPQVTER